jgi:hypothetical protein
LEFKAVPFFWQKRPLDASFYSRYNSHYVLSSENLMQTLKKFFKKILAALRG